MESSDAIKRLSALAHDGRLQVFRLLVKAGLDGLAAGEIARRLDMAANTASQQLLLLSNARLVQARREGRSIIYIANFEAMRDLLVYLTEDCCGGRPEVCAPLAEVANKSLCCPPSKAKGVRHEASASARRRR
jgi:DNA-binding transcriptional ArsR family regulator